MIDQEPALPTLQLPSIIRGQLSTVCDSVLAAPLLVGAVAGAGIAGTKSTLDQIRGLPGFSPSTSAAGSRSGSGSAKSVVVNGALLLPMLQPSVNLWGLLSGAGGDGVGILDFLGDFVSQGGLLIFTPSPGVDVDGSDPSLWAAEACRNISTRSSLGSAACSLDIDLPALSEFARSAPAFIMNRITMRFSSPPLPLPPCSPNTWVPPWAPPSGLEDFLLDALDHDGTFPEVRFAGGTSAEIVTPALTLMASGSLRVPSLTSNRRVACMRRDAGMQRWFSEGTSHNLTMPPMLV